jgi:FMN phosphatase YigB (HAD superfamily)
MLVFDTLLPPMTDKVSSDRPVIFIDWHGTLSSSLFWNSFQQGSAKEQFLHRKICDELFCLFGGDKSEFFRIWDNGGMTSEEFVSAISEYLGEENEWMWFRFVEDCKNFRFDSLSYIDQIESLRRRARIVLATDQGEAFQRFVIPALNLENVFDDIIVSSVVKVSKQEPEKFFKKYLEAVLNGGSMLIDNSKTACEKFTGAGGHAIHIDQDVSTTMALSEALKWVSAKDLKW